MSEIVCVRPRWTAVETAWPEVVLTVCHAPPPGGGGSAAVGAAQGTRRSPYRDDQHQREPAKPCGIAAASHSRNVDGWVVTWASPLGQCVAHLCRAGRGQSAEPQAAGRAGAGVDAAAGLVANPQAAVRRSPPLEWKVAIDLGATSASAVRALGRAASAGTEWQKGGLAHQRLCATAVPTG